MLAQEGAFTGNMHAHMQHTEPNIIVELSNGTADVGGEPRFE